jgi:hypothetical protein
MLLTRRTLFAIYSIRNCAGTRTTIIIVEMDASEELNQSAPERSASTPRVPNSSRLCRNTRTGNSELSLIFRAEQIERDVRHGGQEGVKVFAKEITNHNIFGDDRCVLSYHCSVSCNISRDVQQRSPAFSISLFSSRLEREACSSADQAEPSTIKMPSWGPDASVNLRLSGADLRSAKKITEQDI